MPHNCAVQGCKNTSKSKSTTKLSFHAFPRSKPNILRRWFIKMKHPFDLELSKHAKICSAHFEGGKRKGEDDVPTVFPWSRQRQAPKDRPPPKPRSRKHSCGPVSIGINTDQPEQVSLGVNTESAPSVSTATNTCEVPHLHKLTQTASIALSLSIENISLSDKLVHVYTGFPDFTTLNLCFDFLGPCTSNLLYHNNPGKKAQSSAGAPRSLLSIDEFLLVLCRLRLNLIEEDIAYRFKISQPSVSRIFITWINLLYHKFKEVDIWPSRNQVDYYMPNNFRENYPSTRCVIDATEIFIEQPSSPTAQQLTFSNYKNHNTLKALIGITPSGAISFISHLYGGCISDRQLTIQSGILDMIEPGDSIMADKGFLIADLLQPLGVSLNIPPLKLREQFSEAEMLETRRIASVRIHVERAIGRVKTFHILANPIPNTMAAIADQIFFVCSILTNFRKKLV
ncbi:hypothetical protein SPONN_1005 [uncultured Candidatus Thioglobus sp.]|nr:hypothetical protein SPONL_2129 [uncultured Candidatus Thioglobus sp.]SMN02464.1 hypothetical protein SPONN_1005 [uncultured Candidatus Thioglobus sp.]